MPRSSAQELRDLREEVFERDGGCRWPGCDYADRPDYYDNPLQMAHLEHRGMGGSKERNTPANTILLCRLHHDVFDGRDGSSNTKRELAVMLKAQIR